MSDGTQDPTDRLASLAAMTQETDAANPTPEQQQQAAAQAQEMDEDERQAQEWAGLMFMLGGFACMIAPELKPVYSEGRCLEFGERAHQVAKKYGWTGPSRMPELALLVSVSTFAVPTFFAIREKLKEAKEGKAPDSLLAKVGLWWRTRGARKKAADMADPAQAQQPQQGAGNVVQQ